jgi:hypothetical protein
MYKDNARSFGNWKSVQEQQRDREQQARDRRGEANTEYLADEANN